MALSTTEITWITFFLCDIVVVFVRPPHLLCDNIFSLHMTINPIIHGCTKYIEIDYHFIYKKDVLGQLITHFIPSSLQIADIFTKPRWWFILLIPEQAWHSFHPISKPEEA